MMANKRVLLMVCFLAIASLSLIFSNSDVSAYSSSEKAISDCVKAAYTAGGATNKLEIKNGLVVNDDEVIQAIDQVCRQCENGDNDGVTLSATWINSSATDAYMKGVVTSAKNRSSSVKIYLRTASYSCKGNIKNAASMDRHFVNFQKVQNTVSTSNMSDADKKVFNKFLDGESLTNNEKKKVENFVDAKHSLRADSNDIDAWSNETKADARGYIKLRFRVCPLGTTSVYGGGNWTYVVNSSGNKVWNNGMLPNCENDGFGGVTRTLESGEYSIPSDPSSESSVRSLPYISGISYSADDYLDAAKVNGDLVNKVWSGVGEAKELTIDLKSFREGKSSVAKKHSRVYAETIYAYGCVRSATPGQTIIGKFTWGHAGCVNRETNIRITISDPTLTIKHITTDGTSIANDLSDVGPEYGNADTPIDVSGTARAPGTKYVFVGFKKNDKSSTAFLKANDKTSNDQTIKSIDLNSRKITISEMTDDVTIYAVYREAAYFQGSASVKLAYGDGQVYAHDENKDGIEWLRNGYTDVSGTKTFYINDCDAVNGCWVRFKHRVRLKPNDMSSPDKVKYKITRTYNCSDTICDLAVDEVVGETGFTSSDKKDTSEGIYLGKENLATRYVKLKPGYVVCEKNTFTKSSLSTDYDTNLTICASALGNAQPPDPDPDTPEDPDDLSGDTSYINIKVRNGDIKKYNNYQRSVYAKPGDKVAFRATYNPVLQYTYYLKPQKMRINSGEIVPASGINKNKTLGKLFNSNNENCENNSGIGCWNNGFSISSSGFRDTSVHTYPLGNTEKRTLPDDDYTVATTDVGKTLSETIRINDVDGTKTTPAQVAFVKNGDDNLGIVRTERNPNTAKVLVPYNFINTTEISDLNDKTFFAGERVSVSYKINTNPKENGLTTNNINDKYATRVVGAKSKLIACYNGVCSETNVASNTLNPNGLMNGDELSTSMTLNLPDVDAGTTICLRSAVYPANSGDDGNVSDKEGNHQWAESAEKCFKIAKRPSVQIWGGSFYSAKNIDVPAAAKTNVFGYSDYKASGSPDFYNVFGSWGELDIVAAGKVQGLASGAAMGVALNDNGNLWPVLSPAGGNGNVGSSLLGAYGPGGSKEGSLDYCLRSYLSIANSSCKNGYVGQFGGSGQSSITSNKTALIERFVNSKETKGVEYSHKAGDYTVEQSSTPKNVTRVIDSDGDIIINNDLIYEDWYESLESIPKLILYSRRNIEISCYVNRIDAVLIADGDINTCRESDNVDNEINSRQLKINGSIISNTLTLNRTYGAAKGANSAVPAEIVNYDATLFLWGSSKSSASNTGRLNSVYTHELSPRY